MSNFVTREIIELLGDIQATQQAVLIDTSALWNVPAVLAQLSSTQEKIMAQLDELRGDEAQLAQAIKDMNQRWTDALAAMQAKLDAALAAGGPPPDLSSDIKALQDDIAAVSQSGAAPAPTPAPPVTPTDGGTPPPA